MVFNYLDMNKGYPTNLTNNQWQILQKIMKPTTRITKHSLILVITITHLQLRWQEKLVAICLGYYSDILSFL